MGGLKFNKPEGVQFDPSGQISGVVLFSGGRTDVSVRLALRWMTGNVEDIDTENSLMLLTEHQRTGQLTASDRLRIKRWFDNNDLLFAAQHRKMCWGDHPVPQDHFWWFSKAEQRQMAAVQKAA